MVFRAFTTPVTGGNSLFSPGIEDTSPPILTPPAPHVSYSLPSFHPRYFSRIWNMEGANQPLGVSSLLLSPSLIPFLPSLSPSLPFPPTSPSPLSLLFPSLP